MIGWLLLIVPVFWLAVFRYRRRRLYALASRISGGCEELPGIGIAHKLSGTTEDIMSGLKTLSYSAMENDGMIRAWLGPILYFGRWGPGAHKLFAEIAKRLDDVTGDRRAGGFFAQRINIAIQRGNAAGILGTMPQGPVLDLIAVDPVDLEVVLKTCLEKDDLHRFLRAVIGYGGIFAPVSIWRPRRKILVPAFSPKIVDGFVPVFAKQSMKLASKLGEHAGAGKLRLWSFISSYTLDSVCETAFGVKINAQSDAKSPFLVELNNVLQVVCERIFHLWLQPDWLYKFFPQYRQQKSSLKILHGFTNDVIEKKRDELKAKQSKCREPAHDYEFTDYSNKTFLDILIHLSGGEKGYSNLELREEILTLTIAATDTSATAVGYTLKMMAKYPSIQEKVLQEMDEVFGDSDRLFMKEDLMRLPYLERVIKETLRLFPPVPFIIRRVDEEISLPSGRVLPAGSGVAVSIWGTHRNPKYWGPDAEKFDPDRFLPERLNLKHPGAFMPFSNGPRNCIGYQYALMSIKTALSSVLRYNRVVADPETGATPQIHVKIDVMMKAVDEYEVALERRRPLPQCHTQTDS